MKFIRCHHGVVAVARRMMQCNIIVFSWIKRLRSRNKIRADWPFPSANVRWQMRLQRNILCFVERKLHKNVSERPSKKAITYRYYSNMIHDKHSANICCSGKESGTEKSYIFCCCLWGQGLDFVFVLTKTIRWRSSAFLAFLLGLHRVNLQQFLGPSTDSRKTMPCPVVHYNDSAPAIFYSLDPHN